MDTASEGTGLQERAPARTQELPGAELSRPFGGDWDVWKVRGRVFMLQTQVTGEPQVILKARPEDSATLSEAYTEITPGDHMNKRHWISLCPGGGIDAELVDDLVTESCLLMVERNVPRRERPVDPETFGRCERVAASAAVLRRRMVPQPHGP